MLKDIIDADFQTILGEGFSEELAFTVPATEPTAAPQTLRVRAMVTETTLGAELEVGGMRPKRSFSALARRADFADWLPRPGATLTLDGEGTPFRVSAVRKRPGDPLVGIDFAEKA